MRNGMTASQRKAIVRLMEGAIPSLSADDAKYGVLPDAKAFVQDVRSALVERRVTTVDGIVVPRHATVEILHDLPVDESRPWIEAVKAIDHGDTVEDLMKVKSQFPPAKVAATRRRIILLSGCESGEALRWGEKQNLVPATPRALLAIAEHRPRIVRTLQHGLSTVTIIATLVSCVASLWGDRKKDRYFPYVRWFGSGERRRYGQCTEPVYNIGGGLGGGQMESDWIAFQDRDR
ncbi:MAG: hypothetical protein HYW56_00975 [Candidatus Harrisonbacteria bacterium]|nr:hypothetical protein [Candidatus Harrisonbacteria bacterium]